MPLSEARKTEGRADLGVGLDQRLQGSPWRLKWLSDMQVERNGCTLSENMHTCVTSPRQGHSQHRKQLQPGMAGKLEGWSVWLKRFTAAYSRPERRDPETHRIWGQVVFNKVSQGPSIWQLLHPWVAAAVSTGKTPLNLGVGFGVETLSRIGSCHASTLLGTGHIPQQSG